MFSLFDSREIRVSFPLQGPQSLSLRFFKNMSSRQTHEPLSVVRVFSLAAGHRDDLSTYVRY
jgi:hypothetical protein